MVAHVLGELLVLRVSLAGASEPRFVTLWVLVREELLLVDIDDDEVSWLLACSDIVGDDETDVETSLASLRLLAVVSPRWCVCVVTLLVELSDERRL